MKIKENCVAMCCAIEHCIPVETTGTNAVTTHENPSTPQQTILNPIDIECLNIVQCWLKNNKIDGDIPKEAEIEKIRFVHWADATMAYLTLSGAPEVEVKIHHRAISFPGDA